MTPDSVLRSAPLVLDQRAREQYFTDGFLTVPGYVGAEWLGRLRAVVAAKIDESRAHTASDDQFDLAPDHSADKPNIRRLRKAVDQHPELWTFAQDASVVDLIADLLGPDLRFHSSKLNFKWSAGGDAVRWHQDIQAWPHTNFGVLTFGVYLEDTASAQGPLTAIPGSHDGPIFDQFDDRGQCTGALTARDTATLPADKAVELCGPAGTVVLLHCRVVHGSAVNHSPRMRPLLLNVYSAADALPITPAPAPTSKTGALPSAWLVTRAGWSCGTMPTDELSKSARGRARSRRRCAAPSTTETAAAAFQDAACVLAKATASITGRKVVLQRSRTWCSCAAVTIAPCTRKASRSIVTRTASCGSGGRMDNRCPTSRRRPRCQRIP
jgi:Phytanoyl-CoA dioxygenase (PhyH)